MKLNQMTLFPIPQTSKSLVPSPQTLELVVGAALNLGLSLGATYFESPKFKNKLKGFEKQQEQPDKDNHKKEPRSFQDPLLYTSNFKP